MVLVKPVMVKHPRHIRGVSVIDRDKSSFLRVD